MDVCPYCGEEQNALKNHVRLASGDGHSPSGSYPDDFEEANAGTSQDSQTGVETRQEDAVTQDAGSVSADPVEPDSPAHADDNAGLPATTDDDTVEMTRDEVETMLDTAATEAYEDGYTDGQQQAPPVEIESTVDDSPDRLTCPSCGSTTGSHKPGAKLVTQDGKVLTTEPGDRYCEDCHAIVGDSETHRLAKNPNPKAQTGGSALGRFAKLGLVAVAGVAGLGVAAAKNKAQNQGNSGPGVDVAGLGEAEDPWDGA